MKDIIDQANDLAQLELDNLLANRQTFTGESVIDCIECGEPIPEKRRQLIKGYHLCIDCQSLKELRTKR